MNYKYDFVLLEPSYWHISHSDYDLKCIADILSYLGYKVAVVVFTENHFHDNQQYDKIEIFPSKTFPDIEYVSKEKNKFLKCLKEIVLDFRRYRYFSVILRETSTLTGNLYIGMLTPNVLPVMLASQKGRYFLWGIRSYYLSNIGFELSRNPFYLIKSVVLKFLIKRNKKFYLFVSNHLICNEFKKILKEKTRIIERPERLIQEMPNQEYRKLSQNFTLLTIGAIRPIKNIEFALDVVKDMNLTYIVAGSYSNAYAEKIRGEIVGMNRKNIIAVNKYLSDEEYVDYLHKAHFVLLSDKEEPSVSSNGTFMDALLNCRPVIVPDREPFKFYIDRYGVGLKYVVDDKGSLKKAIEEARAVGIQHFADNIRKFQKNFHIESVANRLSEKFASLLDVYEDT